MVVPLRVPPSMAGWALSLYPSAGEGGGCFVPSYRPVHSYVARGEASDPKRAAEQAGARARGKLRRYCAANRLNRLGTLTYDGQGCHDPRQVRADVGDFFRTLRMGLGGKPVPYVWVPEWHHTDHGLHVHFAVGRFIPKARLRAAWAGPGHGFVHIKLLGDLPVGTTNLGESRMAARYLSKYVAKTFTDPTARVLGLHRYDVAQGFQPKGIRLRGRTSDDVVDQASALFGMAPAYRWSSADTEAWAGPPAIWAQWGA